MKFNYSTIKKQRRTLNNFLNKNYNGVNDFSILQSIAFGLYPRTIKKLASIKLQQIQSRGGKND
jgi:hypothetical protein